MTSTVVPLAGNRATMSWEVGEITPLHVTITHSPELFNVAGVAAKKHRSHAINFGITERFWGTIFRIRFAKVLKTDLALPRLLL